MSSMHRMKYNPIDAYPLSNIMSDPDNANVDMSYLAYDGTVCKGDDVVVIRRRHRHDGTIMFTQQLVAECVISFAKKQVVTQNIINQIEGGRELVDLKYVFGNIWVYGVIGDHSKTGWVKSNDCGVMNFHTREALRLLVKVIPVWADGGE